MRIAVIQLAYDDSESVAERTERAAGLVEQQRGHDLVVLPELWSAGGFDYRSWEERAQQVDGDVVQRMAQARPRDRRDGARRVDRRAPR